MSDALLILWLATLVAERVDFFAGSGPFLLTPFLVLTPVVLTLEVLRIVGRGGGFRVPRNVASYALLATSLLVVVLVSVFLSSDIPTSARRYALLVVQVYGALLGVVFLAQREDPARILVRGAYLGLLLGLVFHVSQAYAWLDRAGESYRILGGVVDITANTYGPWVPRLSGAAVDMNRGGILFVVYLFLLLRFAPPSRLRTTALVVGSLMTMATLSRTTLAAVILMVVYQVVLTRRVRVTARQAVAAAAVTAACAGVLLASSAALEETLELAGPLLHRFTPAEESAGVHVQLLGRAAEVMSRSPKNALVGIGYGNAYSVVQDYFPGNKYGNFHSLYLTLGAECGGIALLLVVLLVLYPVVRGGTYAPLMAGIALFNVPYQMQAEPVFWLVLALAWTRLCDPALRPPPARVAAPAPAPPFAPALSTRSPA